MHFFFLSYRAISILNFEYLYLVYKFHIINFDEVGLEL